MTRRSLFNIPTSSLRPHHRCTSQFTPVTCAGAHYQHGCRPDVPFSDRRLTTVSAAIRPCRCRPFSPQTPVLYFRRPDRRSQVSRCATAKNSVTQHGDLVLYALRYPQPMKADERISDVIGALQVEDQPCRRVQHRLESTQDKTSRNRKILKTARTVPTTDTKCWATAVYIAANTAASNRV